MAEVHVFAGVSLSKAEALVQAFALSHPEIIPPHRFDVSKFSELSTNLILLRFVPPLMSSAERRDVVNALWSSVQSASQNRVYFGRKADFAIFWNEFRRRAERLPGDYLLPTKLTRKLPWLETSEAIAEQRSLNVLRRQNARLKIQGMVRAIKIGLDQMSIRDRNHRMFTYECDINEHRFLLIFDNQTRGISFDVPLEKVPTLSEIAAATARYFKDNLSDI